MIGKSLVYRKITCPLTLALSLDGARGKKKIEGPTRPQWEEGGRRPNEGAIEFFHSFSVLWGEDKKGGAGAPAHAG